MATIKSFSDLQQSKKLAEILPLESADMYYALSEDESINMINFGKPQGFFDKTQVAWSLAALLNVASTYCNRLEITLRADEKYNLFVTANNFVYRSFDEFPDGIDNLVDACVVMIEKLHELKML